MRRKLFLGISVLLFAVGFFGYRISAQEGHDHSAMATVKYSLVNIEYKGTKVWVPSVLIVSKGAKVELKLINNAPSGVHGFSIPDFNVKAEVAPDKPKEVSFMADKAGLFPINCHMHPAHIGGQLYVVELGGGKD